MAASTPGLVIDAGTDDWASRWKMTSGRRSAIRSTRSRCRMSCWWIRNPPPALARACARLASEPVERSSTTSTSWPSASKRSTRADPMNPAPPVTSARIDGQLCRALRRDALRVQDRPRLDLDTGADDRDRTELTALADQRPVAHDRTLAPGVHAHVGPRHEHRAEHRRPGVHHRAPADHRILDTGPRGDAGAGADEARRHGLAVEAGRAGHPYAVGH